MSSLSNRSSSGSVNEPFAPTPKTETGDLESRLPSSDNPARTADYLSRRDARIRGLRELLPSLLVGRDRITLEIGCGHGHFLTAYAKAHPDRFCLGIDLVTDRIERATRKRDRAKAANLAFLIAEAEEFLESLPAGVRLGELFILFPDPWPKRRHHKNRLLQANFLSSLARWCEPNARLCFRTDYRPYFAEASQMIAAHPRWSLSGEPWPFELATVFQERAPSYQSAVARLKCQL